MPITFAHPVAVLPFVRTRLLFSAMAIGSMSPDFVYFFNGDPSGHFGHTIAGVFIFCLPISILFYALFHSFLKAPIISLLPKLDQLVLKKSLEHRTNNLPFLTNLILSVLIGTITHIVWDSFTHSSGWVVSRWEWLSLPILETQFGTLRVFKIFQYSGHLLGAPILILAYVLWIRSKLPASERHNQILGWKGTGLKMVLFIISSSISVFFLIVLTSHEPSIYRLVGKLAVYEINTITISMILYALIFYIRKYSSKSL